MIQLYSISNYGYAEHHTKSIKQPHRDILKKSNGHWVYNRKINVLKEDITFFAAQ